MKESVKKSRKKKIYEKPKVMSMGKLAESLGAACRTGGWGCDTCGAGGDASSGPCGAGGQVAGS